jgi:hypothetical protein
VPDEEAGGVEGAGRLVGGTGGGDDGESVVWDDAEGGVVVGVVAERSEVLLTVGEDVGRIQLPRASKPSGQLSEGGADDDGDGDELPGLVVEGVDVGVSVVGDGDGEELPGLVVGRIQLPKGSKPSGQLSEGGVDDDGDGDELPGLVVEGVDVGVSVVDDGDDEELPVLVVGRIQLPRASKPSGQLSEGGVDDDGDDDELPGSVVEGVDVGVSVVDDWDDEEVPGLVVVGRMQFPRASKPSGQLAGLEEGGTLVDGGELVGDVSDDGGVVVAEELVDGGSVFVEGSVVGGDVASDGEELVGGLELDEQRPSITPRGPQGSSGGEVVGAGVEVGSGVEVDPSWRGGFFLNARERRT